MTNDYMSHCEKEDSNVLQYRALTHRGHGSSHHCLTLSSGWPIFPMLNSLPHTDNQPDVLWSHVNWSKAGNKEGKKSLKWLYYLTLALVRFLRFGTSSSMSSTSSSWGKSPTSSFYKRKDMWTIKKKKDSSPYCNNRAAAQVRSTYSTQDIEMRKCNLLRCCSYTLLHSR